MVMLKAVAFIDAAAIVTAVFPVLVMVVVRALLWLKLTVPKARLAGLAASVIGKGPDLRMNW